MISNSQSITLMARDDAMPPSPAGLTTKKAHPVRSLKDIYCHAHGVPPEQFVDHFLPHALHLSARLFYPAARHIARNIDNADRELLSDLGGCHSLREVRRILSRLPSYYSDWNFWRRIGKFRVSSRQVMKYAAAYVGFAKSAD